MLDQDLKQAQSKAKAQTQASRNAQMAAEADREQKAAGRKSSESSWAGKIKSKIRSNVVLPPGLQGNPEAIFEVNLLPTGEVLNVRLKRSSGVASLDAAIERAIFKSSPLPKPDDPSVFQRDLEIKYRPVDE